MSPIDYDRLQTKADQQIRKGGGLAYLRRASVDRSCQAMEMQLSAHEKRALKNFNNRIFIISAKDLAEPPSKEDSFVLTNPAGTKLTALRWAAPVAPFQPNPAAAVIYYEVQVEGGN